MRNLLFSLVCGTVLTVASTAQAREQIRAVGSSTVYPFVTAVAEEFGKSTRFKSPIIEATGTGGGFKLFCGGVGDQFPDIANASRPIKASEKAMCKQNGIQNIIEVPIGFDGITLSTSRNSWNGGLTKKQVFLALARRIPRDGKLIDNPNKNWNEIDPNFPNYPIEIYGPSPTSGTRDAFIELIMEKACEEFPEFKTSEPDDAKRKKNCGVLREDGAFIEAGENDNLVVQKLVNNKQAIGILGFDYLEQNRELIQAHPIETIVPEFSTIESKRYPISRPLFVYIKGEHVEKIPGIREFVKELLSEKALGSEGYLAFKGLIPLPAKERDATRKLVVGAMR